MPGLRNRLTLFYIGLFLWFIFLFLKRILKVPTTPFWDWFMLLLFAAIIVFYILWFLVRIIKRPSVTKYNIGDIITAGVIHRDGHTYAVFQMQNKENVAINFMNDTTTANSLIAALLKVNGKINQPEN